MDFVLTVCLERLSDLDRLAEALLAATAPPVVYGLTGELGAGKTAFVQALARALKLDEPITSPTFGLVHHYAAGRLVHADFYRLESVAATRELGLEDEFNRPTSRIAVEWADRFAGFLPPTTIWLHFFNGAKRACLIRALSSQQAITVENWYETASGPRP